MTRDQLAALVDVQTAEIVRWQGLGLLGGGSELGTEDVARARLIGFAARRGVPPEELVRLFASQGDALGHFARWAQPTDADPGMTRAAAAARMGLDAEVVERLWAAAGLWDQPVVLQEDLEMLGVAKAALDYGLPEEALVQILRVSADALSKVSEAMQRVFHMYVHEAFRAQGLSGEELNAATASLADPMIGLVEPTVMYFHRKAWERANREDLLLHLIEDRTGPSSTPGELVRTILFVDLVSFTPLTEAMGDAAAAEVIERFAHLVRQTAAACDGQVIKQIGDEFMVMFASPAAAVSFGRAIQARAGAEHRFPALRVGAHTGSVLYRDGDYVGAAVNLAARVTGAAARKQFLVTSAVRDELADQLDLASLGSRALKGVTDPVELFAVPSDGEPAVRFADPICGMELDPASADAQLNWHGRQVLFCSADCLRRFVERTATDQMDLDTTR